MPHTPLADRIRTLAAAAHEAEERGIAPEQALIERQRRRYSRRALLRAASASAAPALVPPPARAGRIRLVIVGAGLAGLTCAYRLAQSGLTATVYEAADRIGGRCWTLPGAFDQGQVVERGGELIDTGHREIRRLARELDLELDDLLTAEAPGTEALYFFDGAPYTIAEATADFQNIWPRLKQDLREAGYPTLYDSYTPRGFALDHLSLAGWIEQVVPGGLASRLGRLLDIAYTIEFGAETSDQSALNLLYLLGYSQRNRLQLFGDSDERFHVRGGNEQIVDRLAARLSGQIQLGHELIALRESGNGAFTLVFRAGGRTREVVADKVVLALPFSILRRSVDYSRAGFSTLKKMAIQDLGMGENSKLLVQFDRRFWRDQGNNGETFSDTGYQNTWEVTRAQPGEAGILVNYTGGALARSFGTGNPLQHARRFLAQLEPALPGAMARWNGFAHTECWPEHRWTRGAYAYWKVGQYTRFAGAERERSRNCFFAGEHTSVDFQGYLNGAVESGERAARQLLSDLK